MSSAFSPAKDALADFVAGRLPVERVVIAVTAAYYGDAGRGQRAGLQAVIDVIDRAAPGIVELGSVPAPPGFEIRLAERPFPRQYEAELRRAAEAFLGGATVSAGGADAGPSGPAAARPPRPGMIARFVGALRRLFSAST